jgi:glycosyltransferase involved in cell wall biosynthesis
MRILHTAEFYSPSVGGAQEVVRQISEQLARRGHEITVATTRLPERSGSLLNGVRIEGFSISGNAVKGYTGETDAYLRFLSNGRFDVMMNYAAQQWATDLAYKVLDQIRYKKVLVPCGFSALYDPQYNSYFRELPKILRRYDHLIFHSCSGRDSDFARRNGIVHSSVVPNGASFEEFREPAFSFRDHYGIPQKERLLITVGTHTGAKGHSVVMEAFRRANIGRATLVVIGNVLGSAGCLPRCRIQARLTELASFGKKKVLLLDPPRRDVVSAYHSADLFLFGSNIECSPIVLFEAAASGTPFVSTACGNAVEIAEWTAAGRIVPTDRMPNGYVRTSPAAMAKVMEELLADKDRLKRLRDAGIESWKNRFTWEKIALQYEELYLRLVTNAG